MATKSDRLKNKDYRDALVAEHAKRGIAYQIRALREQRKWSQGELSQKLGKAQSVVSRIEDPGYGKYSLQTLLEVASAFDVALLVRFAPFDEVMQKFEDVSPAALQVASFEQEQTSNFDIDLNAPSRHSVIKRRARHGDLIRQTAGTGPHGEMQLSVIAAQLKLKDDNKVVQ